MSAHEAVTVVDSSLGPLRLWERLYRSRRTELWSAGERPVHADIVVKRAALNLDSSSTHAVNAALTREAELLRRVHGSEVVELLGVCGSEASVEALVLPRLSHSLDHVTLPLPPTNLVRYASDVCRALTSLHAAHIIHRDVRPANILVRDDHGAASGAVLADLDHALDLNTEAATTEVVGAPGYIAPELHRGRIASPASDVYALGITLFALATGERPFAHPDPAVERRRAAREAALPIASYARHTSLPPSLAAVIEAALTTDPNRRPSVEQFLHAAEERA